MAEEESVPLASGTRLGPYEIVDALGAGGMGEVYRARDVRLDRTVAIKVLPSQFVADQQFQERFEREARSIAALNHPHICTLHDVGHQDGTHFLVMELIEGETLAERLQSGPSPIAETLAIAHQIAGALEAAHEKGILHRDLKPANIKITPDGTVKVLDFGLAKALDGTQAGARLSDSPTLSRLATQAGMVMGTASYMSPEQARGKPVDRRTDVWAFGCVLYEMLTAKRAFDGETITDILGAIVHKEPDWSGLPADANPRLHELLRRCLQKDVKQRLRDMGDVQLEIGSIRNAPAPIVTQVVASIPRWRVVLPWVVSLALAIVSAVAAGAWWRVVSQRQPVTRLTVEISPMAPLSPSWGEAAVLSPDGSQLVYVAGTTSDRQLYVRRLDQLDDTPLPGTTGAISPFFSPDGLSVGFFAPPSLKKVSLTGGAALTVATTAEGRGATWGRDDTIVFTPGAVSGLFRVSADGGTPEAVTTREEKTERSHRWPQFLPGTNAVLFTTQLIGRRWDESNIEVVDLATQQRKVVHQGGTYARYIATGHLLFVRQSTLFAAPFDVSRLQVTAPPVPVLEGVGALSGEGGSGLALYTVSTNGTLAYFATAPTPSSSALVFVDRKGSAAPATADRANFVSPRFSPDGTKIALSRTSPENQTPNIWVYDTASGVGRPLTFSPAANMTPSWTRDGQRVTFTSPSSLYWIPADGSGQPERLTQSDTPRAGSWSPDGKTLAFFATEGQTLADLLTLTLDGDRKPQVFLGTPASESYPEFSPDGRWIAYQSDEAGPIEIYVRAFPDTGGKWQISRGGGQMPRWSRNGRELVYRVPSEQLMSVRVNITAGRSFQHEAPQPLFQDVFAVRPLNSMYDFAPDGKRFVMVQDDSGASAAMTHVTLVFNWFEDLKARLSGRQ
jgi:eukaryotic-like serine/threonine-protein kinase